MIHEKPPVPVRREEIKVLAAAVAEELKAAAGKGDREPIAGTGGGSRHRNLPEPLRQRFIEVRAALFERGIFNPVLARFDTATVEQASTIEVAEELARVAQSL